MIIISMSIAEYVTQILKNVVCYAYSTKWNQVWREFHGHTIR